MCETTGCINYGWLIGSTHNFAISASQNRKFASQFLSVWADIVLTLRNITSDHPMVTLMKQRQMRYDVIIVMGTKLNCKKQSSLLLGE